MNMCESRETILIIDDDEFFREVLCDALAGFGCRAIAFGDIEAAQENLTSGFTPSVIFADRRIKGVPIERRLLHDVKQATSQSRVVIYTRKDELTEAEVRDILAMGATRVLDRSEVAGSADKLLQEFRELQELSTALDQLTRGRSNLVTALVGTDVGVTVIDGQYICWFANAKQRELVCGECTGGLCWNLFHSQPPMSGPCWGCGVHSVLTKGTPLQRTILTHLRDGSVRWLSVQTKPIHGNDDRVIAATEAVSVLEEEYVRNMEPTERLLAVARGLVHAGFGRVRIYQRRGDTKIHTLVAAASRKDRFEDREYFESLRDFAPNYEDCPYCSQASLSKSGILIDSWYSDISPFKDILGLELPYLLVPIRDETNQQLLGLLAADFVGWDKDRGDVAKKHLGRQETCEWIRKGYCKEASRVFRGLRAGSPTISRNAFARLQAALRVGQRIGAASSLDEAIAALREGFAGIAPDCEFCVRRKKGDFLLVEPQLNVPHGLKTKVAIHVDDMKSLAAYVLRTYLRPLWIDDLGAYRQGKGPFAGPKGLSREDVRSAAHLPLRFESTIYGVLSVDSRNPHNWREEGFVDPLINVAERAALILRDLAIQDDRQEAEHMRVQAQVAELKTIAGVADHLPVAVFVKDSSHRFLYVNEQFCRDVGRARQDVIGATDVDLYDEKHGTYYQSTDDEIVKTGRTYENKNEPHPDPEGRKREVHVIKKPFRFSSGSGDGVVGVFWDVTESQQGFRQLQAWRDGFVQSANAIVYAYDLTGEITFANQAAITSLGYGISELVGMSVYDLVLTDDHEALRATILPTLAPSGATTGGLIHEFRVKANDGRVVSWEVATSLCEISPGKEGILAVAHDVTERDHAREQLAHELARTQALRSIASGLGRAAEISALYRLFMLAVTHGECLGFSRAILFLPSENTPRRFVARLAVGTTTLAAARDRWKEAEQVHIEDAVVRCLRSEVNVRTGDLQVMVNGLTIDLDEEPALAHGLCRGEPVIRHLREPSPIRSPQFAAATYSDSGREVESVLAPLREGEGLLAILWADRAFLEDPVIRKGIIQQLEILCTETALTVQALSTRARSEETKVAQDIARGMSYSLLTRAGILEFDLLLLKLKLGDQHTDAIKKMSESIAFFKHAGALATKDWRFTDVGITECMNMDFNHAVREVVERRQDGNITIRLCEHSLPVHMNRTHAEDIVVETLANAMAFCDKDSPRVEVTTRGDGAFAYFEVTDNGKGIHPAMRPDLYKRFKRYPEGRLGMGLAYVKDLVDAYGGSIIEVGRAGSGAHFVVKLPLRQQEVEKNGT